MLGLQGVMTLVRCNYFRTSLTQHIRPRYINITYERMDRQTDTRTDDLLEQYIVVRREVKCCNNLLTVKFYFLPNN